MSEKHSKLYYFFLADYGRITVNILVLIGFILFIIVLYKAFSKKTSGFKLLFIVMINVMICALLSIVGYIFNWKIKDENDERVLLFGDKDGALCIIQSLFLNFFQTARESLLTSLTIIVFFTYLEHNVEKTKYKILIFLFCYGVPFASNILCLICDGFTENDLFCFTKVKGFGKTFGVIHYLYLIALALLNLGLVSSILIMDYKQGKKFEDWLDDEKGSKCCCVFIDPLLKKIIPYPFAQFAALTFPIIYRVGNKAGNSVKWAKIAAIGNSFAAVFYTLIFFYFNKIVLDKDSKENNLNKQYETQELEGVNNE